MVFLLSFWFLMVSALMSIGGDFNTSLPFQNQLGEYYSVAGHPKAKGVNLKIKVPKGWEMKEGDRPNVVVKFVKGLDSYMILIKDLPTFFSKNQARELFSDPKYTGNLPTEFKFLFDDVKILNKEIISIDNYPALEFEINGTREQYGFKFKVKMKVWQIIYEDKIISLQGADTNFEGSFSELIFFTELTNSVLLPDQYLIP